MAISLKYGEVKIEGIPDDEPVFILRAKDRLAIRQIGYYWIAARAQGCKEAFLKGLDEATEAFEKWLVQNQSKLPD